MLLSDFHAIYHATTSLFLGHVAYNLNLSLKFDCTFWLFTVNFFALFYLHVKLEKAEILEKTITYIKKLQEITGKQELKTGIKPGDSRPQGELKNNLLTLLTKKLQYVLLQLLCN